MKPLEYLKSNINSDASLLSIIDTFGRMCRIDTNSEDEMFLFESGTQEQNGHKHFVFSMVRQFNCSGDEPMQIHLDVLYLTNNENKNVSESSWQENYSEMIQAALLSKAFELCKNREITKIDIWADKT